MADTSSIISALISELQQSYAGTKAAPAMENASALPDLSTDSYQGGGPSNAANTTANQLRISIPSNNENFSSNTDFMSAVLKLTGAGSSIASASYAPAPTDMAESIASQFTGSNQALQEVATKAATDVNKKQVATTAASAQTAVTTLNQAADVGREQGYTKGVTDGLSAAQAKLKSMMGVSPTSLQDAVNLGATAAKTAAGATLAASDAAARVANNDALAAFNAAVATNNRIIGAKLKWDDSSAIQQAETRARLNLTIADHIAKATAGRAVTIAENPLDYLYERVIGIDYHEDRARAAFKSLQMLSDVSASNADYVARSSIIDLAANSQNTLERARAVSDQIQNKGIADSASIGMQLAQQNISAYGVQAAMMNAQTSQINSAMSAEHLAMAKFLFPGQLQQQGLNIEASKASIALAEKQKDNVIAATELNVGNRQLQLADRKRADTVNADQTKMVNFWAAILGIPPVNNVDDLTRTESGKNLYNLYAHMAANDGAFGTTPFDSVNAAKAAKLNLAKFPLGHQATVQHIEQVVQTNTDAVHNKLSNTTRLTKDELAASNEAAVTAAFAREAVNVKTGNRIYAFPTLGYAVTDKGLGPNPITQSIAPLAHDGAGNSINRAITGDLLINAAVKLVIDGKLTPTAAAASLVDFGKRSLTLMRETSGFSRFAIPDPTNLSIQYRLPGQTSTFGSADILNPAKALTALQFMVAKQKAEDIRNEVLINTHGSAP